VVWLWLQEANEQTLEVFVEETEQRIDLLEREAAPDGSTRERTE
jgi:hypothetical protein